MIKEAIKRTFIYTLWRKYKAVNTPNPNSIETSINEWNNNGRPVPPPHPVKIATIKEYAKRHNQTVFIETGTYLGETTDACLHYFEQLITIEIDTNLYNKAIEKFKPYKNVTVLQGDSGDVLAGILKDTNKPALFWLDGHYSEGFMTKGKLNTPILSELNHIFNHGIKNHTILIDDARCFNGQDDYPTMDELRLLVHKHDKNLIFSVHDDIIRIHCDNLADIHYTSNNIHSTSVQPESLLGNHIEVREGTAIDKNSTIGSYTYYWKPM